MQIIKAPTDAVLAPLAIVGSVVDKRNPMPILSHILIKKSGRDVSFTGTDLEMQITTNADVGSGLDEATTTVNARTLMEIIKSLPAADVSLTAGKKGGQGSPRATIQAGKSKFNVQTLDAADFPVMQEAAYSVDIELPAKALRHLFDMVHFAMAVADLRYYLNGTLLTVHGNQLTAVATDGHRLAMESVPLSQGAAGFKAIVPRKTVMELLRLLPKGDEPVKLRLAEKQVKVSFGAVELISKVIEGAYPDYERVVPKKNDKEIIFNRAALLAAVERIAILANEKLRGLRIRISAGVVQVEAQNADQEQARDELDVIYAGSDLEIGFNEKYVREVLANLESEEVSVSFLDATTSAVVSVPGNVTFKYLLMPQRL